jgi:ABC-2 type transport system permease protein
MVNLLRAEWLKLSKRPITWILLGIFLLSLVMQILGNFLLANFALVLNSTDSVNMDQSSLGSAEEWQNRSSFPGIFGLIYGNVNSIGGILAVILAAASLGGEYSWGTLRTQLARDPKRIRYFFAKLITLLALFVIASIIALILGSLIAWGLSSLVGRPSTPSLSDLLLLPMGMLRALFVILPYVLITLCFTIMGRSQVLGLSAGLIYMLIDVSLGSLSLFSLLGGFWQTLYNLSLQPNITTLTNLNARAFGLRPELLIGAISDATLPSPLQAVITVIVYSAISLGTSLYLLRKRDIGGAG